MKLRKALIATGILILFAVLIPIIHHYQLRFATSACIAELKAKGEPLDLAKVLPPPVPADQNSTDTFRRAVVLFGSDPSLLYQRPVYDCMKIIAPGKAMAFPDQPTAVNLKSTNSWEEVAAAVAQNKEAFDLLQQIIDKPAFDFQIPYEQGVGGIDFRALYIVELRDMTWRLQAATLSDLHRGDGGSAVKDVRAVLALINAMRSERLIVTESVRITLAGRAFGMTWEILQSTNITSEQLAPLQHDWEKTQFVATQEDAIAMQRVINDMSIQNWRRSDADLLARLSYGGPASAASINATVDELRLRSEIFYWRYWWSYQNELLALKGFQVLLDTSRFQKTNASWLLAKQQLTNNLAKLAIPTNNGDSELHFAVPPWIVSGSDYFERVLTEEAKKQLAAQAIALKRYQLKYGKYPPDLAALVPEFIPEVLRDPFDGQPLRYRLNPDGTFVLYSIGSDGKDDGGDATAIEQTEGGFRQDRDVVWPRRATPQEIENFKKNSPK